MRVGGLIRAIALGVVVGLISPPAGAAPPGDDDDRDADADEADADEAPPTVEDQNEDQASASDASRDPDGDGFVPPAEDAPAAERAKAWFLRGVELYRAGRYTEAAQAYEASARAVPRPSTVYNAALSHDRAGHKLLALEAFEDYLAMLTPQALEDPVVAEGADKANERIRVLTPEIAHIELAIDDALEVVALSVDSEARRIDEFPLRVLPGPHKVEAVDADGATTIEVVDLLPGERVRVRLEPRPEPPAADPVTPTPDPAEADIPDEPVGPAPLDPRYVQRVERVRLAGWSMLGVTGVSGITWAVLGGLTLDAKGDFESKLCGGACEPGTEYPADEEDRFLARRSATNTLVGITGAVGLTAAALLIAGYTGKAKRVPKKQRGRRPATVSATPGGLRVHF